jgi:DNA-binding response OmpR family regulator
LDSKSDNAILHICDDADIISALFYPLEKQGYNVLSALNNDEALRLIDQQRDNIVLVVQDGNRLPGQCLEKLNIKFSEVSVEFCKRFVLSLLPGVPNIFLAVRNDKSFMDSINSIGAHYVAKPVRPSEFASIVNSILNEQEKLYDQVLANEQLDKVRIDFLDVNEALISYLVTHPKYMYELNPRKFEELIAKLLEDAGYTVTLTPQTRDGGKDIYALYKSEIGHILTLVECKRYRTDHPVGVDIVRSLYGVKVAERANKAVVITTSFFTKDALDFKRKVGYEMSLKDYDNLVYWLRKYKKDPKSVF